MSLKEEVVFPPTVGAAGWKIELIISEEVFFVGDDEVFFPSISMQL